MTNILAMTLLLISPFPFTATKLAVTPMTTGKDDELAVVMSETFRFFWSRRLPGHCVFPPLLG